MTIYFYLPTTPSNRQISKVYALSLFDKETLTITCDIDLGNDVRVNIKTNQEIYSIDVLTCIQEHFKEIFGTCTVFVR